jgi:PEP-CTERM motif
MKTMMLGMLGAVALAAPAAVSAQTVTFNSAPTGGFQYGAGNNYVPANATVLTNGNNELAVRFHQTSVPAPASVDGVYSFALGTSPISYDFSIGGVVGGGSTAGSNILLTNLLTGMTAQYNPLFIGNDNTTTPSGDIQNSARLNFGFLSSLGFNPNVNNTYRIDLSAGGNTVTSFAQIGSGAVAAAVPEPATWGMMLIGFAAMGVSMRRRRRTSIRFQAA